MGIQELHFRKSILKHNALLTVRKKFKNILSLYLHVELNHPPKKLDQSLNEEQSQNQQSQIPKKDQNQGRYWITVSEICAAYLQAILDKRLTWNIPNWIKCSTPKTLKGFIKQMRIIIQHEVSYIPEEMRRKLTAKELGEGQTWQVQLAILELGRDSEAGHEGLVSAASWMCQQCPSSSPLASIFYEAS
ncbi:hypothetical protein EJB05_27731, partial [Eragrostis curvula]